MNNEKMMFKRWVPTFVLCGMMLCVSVGAEDFTDFALKALDGTQVSTESVRRDKVLVVKLGATWCGYCRQETNELKKLRDDFDPSDLSIVEVYLQEERDTVAAHTKDLPFTILLDSDGAVAKSFGVTGIPVVLVVDPNGEIAYRGNYTPHVALRESVKTALAVRKAKPSPKTTAGIAQTVCPVMGGAIDKSVYTDYKGQRIYFCCAACKSKFEADPETYLNQLADQGVAPETVAVICTQCGQIKGSDLCCVPGQTLCAACGLVKDSPGCCKIEKGADATVTLCLACGNIEGSAECIANCGTAKATCPECGRVKGSPECCKSADQLADAGLCASCGLVKGSATCCKLQGKELCPSCGLVKGSAGCCTIL